MGIVDEASEQAIIDTLQHCRALAIELEKKKAQTKAGEVALKKPGEKVAADRMRRQEFA